LAMLRAEVLRERTRERPRVVVVAVRHAMWRHQISSTPPRSRCRTRRAITRLVMKEITLVVTHLRDTKGADRSTDEND